MQNPSVKGLQAIYSHCTIAHITVLLLTESEDKIYFLKSFLPTIYFQRASFLCEYTF